MPSDDARAHPVSPELRRRFERAEKIRIGETALRRPALRPTESALRRHFESEIGRTARPLENPHVEPRVAPEARGRATPASVLLAIVLRETGPTLIVTRRPAGISYPGHWVFPGGRADAEDATPLDTALREAEEEIGLDPGRVEVLGHLGEYVRPLGLPDHTDRRVAPTAAPARSASRGGGSRRGGPARARARFTAALLPLPLPRTAGSRALRLRSRTRRRDADGGDGLALHRPYGRLLESDVCPSL
ncbi:MAG: CoA pyrophosphatase [Myxococcota bacterium]